MDKINETKDVLTISYSDVPERQREYLLRTLTPMTAITYYKPEYSHEEWVVTSANEETLVFTLVGTKKATLKTKILYHVKNVDFMGSRWLMKSRIGNKVNFALFKLRRKLGLHWK